MAKEMPNTWKYISFFAVGVAQQPMLMGITLPAYTVHFVDAPLGLIDIIATIGCIIGIAVAWRSDNELREYM